MNNPTTAPTSGTLINVVHYTSAKPNITVSSSTHNLVLSGLDNPNGPTTLSKEPQHGDPVESWTTHTHSILLICPKCRQPVSRPYQSYYKIDRPHFIHCACGQSFGVKWLDKTGDAQITIHTYVDIDIPEDEEEQEA